MSAQCRVDCYLQVQRLFSLVEPAKELMLDPQLLISKPAYVPSKLFHNEVTTIIALYYLQVERLSSPLKCAMEPTLEPQLFSQGTC